MISFPKIDTLFKRGETFELLDPLEFRNPAMEIISKWVVTEKIDGMNMRVSTIFDTGGPTLAIAGRSDKAQIPGDLTEWIYKNIQPGTMRDLFKEDTPEGTEMVLFGEGYGAGIQKGGYYAKEKKFILFDVALRFPDSPKVVWLPDEAVTSFASRLNLARVPLLATGADVPWIVNLVKNGFQSQAAKNVPENTTCIAEGVVARPIVPLFDARGQRIILKLKTHDFFVTKPSELSPPQKEVA